MSAYKTITTVCPYCGAGCVIDCTVDTEHNCVVEAKGSPDGVNNEGRLCLKGLYGWDYLNDPQILTRRLRQPMIRKFGKDSRRSVLGRSYPICRRTAQSHHQVLRPRYGHGRRLGPRPGKRSGLYHAEIHARSRRHKQRRPLRPRLTRSVCCRAR